MAKKLNSTIGVNLAFTADTDRAKRQLQDLQNQLSKIISQPMQLSINDTNMTQKLREASLAAADLKVHLEKATNVDTGTLDFSKLSQSIKQSGTSLNEYANKIKEIGPVGQQAFLSLAQSVTSAEIPIKRSNKLVTEMWTSLKNTARWQISSSVLHGFTGALQSAYGYAEDLNESLNNIRIVTGQSIEQMADFAKEANKAAKALSTTTTEYTKASLIYYQQGLSDKEVKDRTDITIKMANAAGQNAETVSDQLTAVWNNFYDGSKSLEYYADVMTALGAATASSTEEISTGLNKFAAIAETVGLSYEYAASALATVTATTRQSADIVGTAFKTLFARIQDLELGKTLDDGTTLGKYSAALDTIGVNIKDDNDNLKEMDQILEEMAAKWDTISKDEQTALAQTVAGTRQYTQLVALMENWDFMQQNLGTSYGATGTLNEQAEIYAESWEAARDRVQASMETIYEKILDDEFFIDLLDGLEKTITGVDNLIDSMGGLKGILGIVGSLATKIFSKQLSQGLQNVAYNIKMATPMGRKDIQNQRTSIIEQAINSLKSQDQDNAYQIEEQTRNSMIHELELQQALTQNAAKMNEHELARNKLLLDRNKILEEQAIKLAQERDVADAKVDNLLTNLRGEYLLDNPKGDKDFTTAKSVLLNDAKVRAELSLVNSKQTSREEIQKIINNLEDKNLKKDIQEKDIANITGNNIEDIIGKIQARIYKASARTLKETFGESMNDERIKEVTGALDEKIIAERKHMKVVNEANATYKNAKEAIENVKGTVRTWSDDVVKATNIITNVVTSVNMLRNAWETIRDPDASGWERLLTVFTTMSMVIPTIAQAIGLIPKELRDEIAERTIIIPLIKKTIAARKAEAAAVRGDDGADDYKQFLKDNGIQENEDGSWSIFSKKGKNKKNELVWDGDIDNELNGQLHTRKVNGKSKLIGVEDSKKIKEAYEMKNASKVAKEAGKEAVESGAGALAAGSSILGPLLAIAAAIAAIALTSKLITALDPVTKASKALKKARESANQAKEAADEANQAYNNLKDTLNSYDESVEGLDKLIKGTEEFEQAIEKANEQALELMNTYGALGTYNAETGLWEISKSEQKDIEKKLKEEQIKAQINSLTAQAELSKATLQNQKGQIAGRDDVGFWGQMYNIDEFNDKEIDKILAKTWTSILLPNNAFALPINGLIGQVEQNIENKRSIEAFEKIAEIYSKNGGNLDDAYNTLSKQEQRLININDKDLRNELQKLCEATKAQTEATREYNKAIIDNTFSEDDIYSNSENKEALSNILASRLEAEIEKSDWIDKNSKIKVRKEYARDLGYTYLGQGEEKGTWRFQDAQGNIHEVNKETARYYLAQQEALEDLTDEIKKLDDTLTKIKGSKGGADADLLYAIAAGGDIGDVAIGKIAEGKVTNDAGELASQFSLTPEQLTAIASSAGYDDLTEFMNWYTKQFQDAQEKIKSLDWVTGFEGSSQLLYSDAQKLNDNFSKLAFGPKGQVAASNIQTQLNDEIKQLNSEEQAAALSQLANVDFTNWDAIDQVKTIMEDFGLATEYTDVEWKKLAEDMRIAAGATPDYSKLKSDLAGVASIIKDLDFGSIISDEDYEKLLAYSDAWDKYFMLQVDGTRKFIGSQSEIKKAMLDQARAERAAFEERLKVQTAFLADSSSNIDWDRASGRQGMDAIERFKKTSVGVDVLKQLNTSSQDVDRMLYYAKNGDSNAITELEELYKRIAEFSKENLGKTDAEMDQMLASTAESYEELKLIQDELVSKEANEIYDKQLTSIAKSSLSASENVYELAAAMYEAKEQGVDLSELEISYEDNLLRIAEGYDLCAEAVEAYKLARLSGDSELESAAQEELIRVLRLAQATKDVRYSDIFDINRTYDRKMESIDRSIEDTEFDIEGSLGSDRLGYYDTLSKTLNQKEAAIGRQLSTVNGRVRNAKTELIDFGFSVDSDGNITNYDAMMQKMVDDQNYYQSLLEDNIDENDAYAKTQLAATKEKIEQANELVDIFDTANDEAITLNKNLEDTRRQQLEKTIEKFEKAQDDFDSYVDTLESYKDFMQLIGDNKSLTESLNAINDINKQAFDTAKIAYEQIRETADSTPEQVAAAQKEMLDSMKAWTESLKEVVLNELKGFDKEFANAMLGDMTFDEMAQNLQYAQSLQEEYLTDTNKIYETNKLINEAQKQIDATTNNVAKQKLKNFIEQTKELEKQNKLSKFELDIRKAEYDVMLAEIALQEAQQAKSAVRLRRDSEGNFGYVYTADAGQVADAEQRLADAQNALYNVGLDGANKYAQRQVQITQEAQDAISQLTQQWINGEIESEEEYKRRVAETTEYYVAKYEEASNLLSKASAVDASIASESWAASFAEQFKNLDDFESKLSEYTEKSYKSVDGYKDIIKNTVGSEDGGLTEIFDKTKTAAEVLASAIGGGGSTATESDTPPVNETIEDYGKKSQEAVDNGGQALEENMNNTTDNANALTTALSGGESEGGLNRALDAVNETIKASVGVFDQLKDIIQQTVGETYALSHNLSLLSDRHISITYDMTETLPIVNKSPMTKQLVRQGSGGRTQDVTVSQFDTGGYTGQWGSAGKLAILDEKEIVLNQDDTVNLLASIELLRGIVDTLDVQTASQMMGGILTSPGYNNNYSNPIEQNVKIEASFPAVQDRNEIEEAFNNLINKASQYANRK